VVHQTGAALRATKAQMEQRHVPANRNARIPRLIPLLQESRQLAWDTSPPRS